MKIYHQKTFVALFLPIICMFSLSSVCAKEPKEMKPREKYCERATLLSQGLSEMIASRLKVSVSSVTLIGASAAGDVSCAYTVDTPKGPIRCLHGTVYSDGEDYWIGGYC